MLLSAQSEADVSTFKTGKKGALSLRGEERLRWTDPQILEFHLVAMLPIYGLRF